MFTTYTVSTFLQEDYMSVVQCTIPLYVYWVLLPVPWYPDPQGGHKQTAHALIDFLLSVVLLPLRGLYNDVEDDWGYTYPSQETSQLLLLLFLGHRKWFYVQRKEETQHHCTNDRRMRKDR